ncbi:MAG: ATP-binding protein [Sulfitobacter sp.]
MQNDLTSGEATHAKNGTLSENGSGGQDLDDFIYLISHDVRASVRALLELPQWIVEDLTEAGIPIDGQLRTSIELMNRHTGRLDRMLVDLLAFSRVGRMQPIGAIVVAEALDDVLEHTRVPAGFKITKRLDCANVTMGERDLPTLLEAMISNAIKHHDRETGEILVCCRCEGAQVLISVSDDGPGIEEQFHDRIFAPMTTLRPRDEVEGSGMGLAKVRKIARQYGGDVDIVTSPFARGTSVVVRVPTE